ncbi:MAG TPA: lysophospholipid acyltransferase family protein [Thermoanaerobaculia bacterium]|jgi:KDO2-lipid IV(A) lauroyltransferase|nr:lysophospholipid acyltransferase family protein [Thermoanaerobaculia bacterium]
MQEKMASRNRFVRAVAAATSRVWFPAVLAAAGALPRRMAGPVSRRVGEIYFRARPKYRRAIEANLSIILGRPEGSREVEKAALEMVRGHSSAWFDFLRFVLATPEEASKLIESVIGFSHLVEARMRGKGVVLLTGHLGNWEIGGLMLAQIRQPIHVVLVPDRFPGVERVRHRLHSRAGVTEIPVDRTIAPTLSVLRALEGNAVVAMQGDRDFDNTGVAAPFFGRDAYFPRGPLRVAMATGAVVLPSFIVRVPDGRYRAIIEEPLEIETSGSRDDALRVNLSRYLAVLERYVREYPDQWYCFYPFWDDPTRRESEIGKR